MMFDTKWYEDREDLIAFGKAMTSTGECDIDWVWEYLEKPWKWSDEFHIWCKLGRPPELEDTDHVRYDVYEAHGARLARQYARP